MVVFVLETVPASLRGEMTRWLLEVHAGIFVGDVSAMVRDKLWELTCQKAKGGRCILTHTANTEQGFAVRFWSHPSRVPVDYEGLTLLRRRPA